MEQKKDFAPNIGFWPAKSGNGHTLHITPEVLEVLKTASVGGRLHLKENAQRKSDTHPSFRVSVFPPSEGGI